MSGGSTVPFRDVVQFAIGGGWGREDPGDEHIAVAIVRGTDLASVRSGDLKTIPRRFERASKVERRLLQPGDIVLEVAGGSPSSGQSTGRTAFITRGLVDQAELPLIPASFCRLVRLNADVIDPRYGYYALQEMYSSGRARNYENQSTGIANFQFERFLDFEEVWLPPIEEQRAIASVLGALDDKIELNRRTNETLEALARAIFTSWFVDFDPVRAKAEGRQPVGMDAETAALFPDSFEDSPLGPIPSGWHIVELRDVAANVRDQLDPSSLELPAPYIGLDDMPRRSISLVEWGSSAEAASAKSAFRRGDVLFGKLRPYFHKVGVAPIDGICSTDILVLRASAAEFDMPLVFFASSDAFVQLADSTSAGTKMPRANWHDLGRSQFAPPPLEVLRAFDSVARPMLHRLVSNVHEARTLAMTRDLLLPKLISGQMRVSPSRRAATG